MGIDPMVYPILEMMLKNGFSEQIHGEQLTKKVGVNQFTQICLAKSPSVQLIR